MYDKKEQLIQKLESVDLVKINSKLINGWVLDFYFSTSPDEVNIWWTNVYSDFFIGYDKPKNQVYFGLLLISKDQICYAVSLGKSHFYLKNFSDINFGLNLAERIVDDDNLRTKNAKFYNSTKVKVISMYQDGSGMDINSGESIHYLKAKTIDSSIWGKFANFGHSAQFSINISPNALPTFIERIENTLKQQQLVKIPRVVKITDLDKIADLDLILANAILENENTASLQENEIYLSGVEFLFSDQCQYSFFIQGKKHLRSEIVELSIENLKNFLSAYNIDLISQINSIRINIHNELAKHRSISLKEAVEYVESQDRYCLIDGFWHQFNQSYIEFLSNDIDNISLLINDEVVNDKDEDAFNKRKVQDGYINCDKVFEVIDGKKVEKLDLYKDASIFAVKIGVPQKLHYVLDQSSATVRLLQNNQSKLMINGVERGVKNIGVWLILKRKTPINKISDINSLIFHMKLSEWKRLVQQAGYKPLIYVSYKV